MFATGLACHAGAPLAHPSLPLVTMWSLPRSMATPVTVLIWATTGDTSTTVRGDRFVNDAHGLRVVRDRAHLLRYGPLDRPPPLAAVRALHERVVGVRHEGVRVQHVMHGALAGPDPHVPEDGPPVTASSYKHACSAIIQQAAASISSIATDTPQGMGRRTYWSATRTERWP